MCRARRQGALASQGQDRSSGNTQDLLVGFFLPDAGAALGAAFFAGTLALDAAAFALAEAVVPVIAFLAAPRLEATVVFFWGVAFF